ncbi:putative GTP-binding protein EngB, partial [Grifola frondosa]
SRRHFNQSVTLDLCDCDCRFQSLPPCDYAIAETFMSHFVRQHANNILLRRHISTKAAAEFFSDARSAEFLAAAGDTSSIPRLYGLPEVSRILRRANVGKSTLLNAVLGRRNLLHTSKQPGRTRTLNFYRVGAAPGKLVLVDAPGYGARGRPEWGSLFDHFVQNRPELRRVYILFHAKHGLSEVDKMMLQSLNEQCSGGVKFTLQAIITKADMLLSGGSPVIKNIQKEIFEAAPNCLPAIITSVLNSPYFGIGDVRRSIVEACGLEKGSSRIYQSPP